MTLRIWLIANHAVPWATGSDLRRTLEGMGVEVRPLQDEDFNGWRALIDEIKGPNQPDAVIWNATPALSGRIPPTTRREMQFRARLAGVPTVAFHLDRWWGLQREPEVYADPFFQCEYVFTADGHPHPWEALGINHEWLPPGIAPFHCVPGNHLPQFSAPITFVGSWGRYGHPEWTHRAELVQFLNVTYGAAVKLWPERGRQQVRGEELNDLYASVDIVVGDSCLLSDGDGPYTRFSSDRIPETLGRGGCLIHPWVDGVTDGTLYTAGEHLATWLLGDWDELKGTIDHLNENPDERQKLRDAGRAHVAAWHTYDTRMMRVLTACCSVRPPKGYTCGQAPSKLEGGAMAKLRARTRRRLRKSQFGLPGRRAYPVHDRAHAASAKARSTQMYNRGRISKSTRDSNPRPRKSSAGQGAQEALSG